MGDQVVELAALLGSRTADWTKRHEVIQQLDSLLSKQDAEDFTPEVNKALMPAISEQVGGYEPRRPLRVM